MNPRQRTAVVVPGVALALTLAALAPVLAVPGFVLVYDMVFVPRQPLLPSGVGLGPALPRAVPADAVVALLSYALPGDVLQKLALGGALLLGAIGVARLVPTGRTATRVVAAVGYTWNAFVAERLFLGHWTVLLAYGVLPWVVLAGLAVRRGDVRGWPRMVLWMLPAVIGPTGGLLVAGAAVAAVGRRRALPAAGLALLLNAPWWVPALLRPGDAGAVSDPAGVAAFAARGESWGGPVLSVLGLGGIWNADVVPASRDSPLVPLVTVLLTVLALYGCRELAARWGARPAGALLLLGALGVVIGVAGSVPVLDAGLRLLVEHVPGAGLVRDGQRWAAWWALVLAVGVALGAERLAGVLRRRLPEPGVGPAAVLAGAALLPLAMLPDLAWGGLGRLEAVRYPADWARAAEVLAREPGHGDVLVLPFMTYRAYAWNDHRVQLDPAPRLLPETTVTDDALPVGAGSGATIVAGEDPRVAAARRALAEGRPLRELGVGWVLVQHGTPAGPVDTAAADTELRALTPAYAGDWVTLYRLPEPGQPPADRAGAAPAVPVLAADAVALLLAGGAILWLLLPVGRVRRTSVGER